MATVTSVPFHVLVTPSHDTMYPRTASLSLRLFARFRSLRESGHPFRCFPCSCTSGPANNSPAGKNNLRRFVRASNNSPCGKNNLRRFVRASNNSPSGKNNLRRFVRASATGRQVRNRVRGRTSRLQPSRAKKLAAPEGLPRRSPTPVLTGPCNG